MPSETATRTVTVFKEISSPEGDRSPAGWQDTGMMLHILAEGDDPPPSSRACEKVATFELEGPAFVERSRLMLVSANQIPELQDLPLSPIPPYQYVLPVSPTSATNIFNSALSPVGSLMGIRSFRKFDPPIPMD